MPIPTKNSATRSEDQPKREDFPDGSAILTYPDGSQVILESDLAAAGPGRERRPASYSKPPPAATIAKPATGQG